MITTFNFQKDSLSDLIKFYKTLYPNDAQGWQTGVYYPRHEVKNEFKPNLSSNEYEVHTKDWYEVGGALNGDEKTCPHYHYAETTHFQISAKNANYKIKIELYNPEHVERNIDIYINDILETTITIPYCSSKKVELDIALSRDILDLYFANHNASKDKATSVSWSLNLLNLVLEEKPLKSKSNKLGLYVASDSTAQTYSLKEEPQSGWAEEMYHQLRGSKIRISRSSFYPQATKYILDKIFIDNRSMGARSSKTFITEGRLESILKDINPGDYLLIQFGDNDATAIRPNRYVPDNQFSKYIREYIESAKARKANPILVSPPSQFKMDSNSHKFVTTFEGYRNVMKSLSDEYDIPLIELGHEVAKLLNELGFEAAHALYLQVNKEDYPNLSVSKRDITHFQHYGAFRLAQIVVSNLKKIIGKDYFETRNFKEDLRPVLDDRLHKVHLVWDHVLGSDFNVIEIETKGSWQYLDVTTKDNIYVEFVNSEFKGQYRVLSYNKDGNVVKEQIVSLT